MPLRLEIKRKLLTRSDRVKSIDFHPTEPWVVASLYNGNVYIWDYANQVLLKSFEVSDVPVRTAKFIARKQWVATGSDDMCIRVYSYNTMDKVKAFEAHADYIRSLAVHPTLPFLLSSSDDMLIKLWDWEKNWQNVQVFEGHTHYVMQIVWNIKDTNTFASASLDRTIKVWGLGSPNAHFTLEGHDKGVNCLDYFAGGDKPFLISGADDRCAKVWDYQTKTCVQTLEGHSHNVSAVCFHPSLPIIVSGSEDGTVRIWHANTYRLENTLNYGLERVWSVGYLKGSNKIAIGYDEGTVVVKLGRDQPSASMDSGGKIIWAKHNEIQTVNVKTAGEADFVDGEKLPLATKDLGSCEVYPQNLKHSPNGRFVVVCGDGEYIIYTALAWRNKSFGSALDFVWAADSGDFATRETSMKVAIFSNFKERMQFKPMFPADTIYGGVLLGIRSGDSVIFHHWDEGAVIRKIDVAARNVYWSESGDLVTIACDSAYYILKYNRDLVHQVLETGQKIEEDGIEDAFELLHEVSERIRTGLWVGDCFIYTNSINRLNYFIGGQIVTLHHLDRPMYILGYIARDNRLYLTDKDNCVISYHLLFSIFEFQTAVVRHDMNAAAKILKKIPREHHSRVARFLEAQDLKEEALAVTTDPEHRFELAVHLGKLDVAYSIVLENESEQKWKQLGDLAMNATQFDLAEECLQRAEDLGGLLLLYTSTGNDAGVEKLGQLAAEKGKNNVAFLCMFLRGQLEGCLDLLCQTHRIPEAALLARTYLPSHMSRIVRLWKEDLANKNQKAADALADPEEYPNLFADLGLALKAEELFMKRRYCPIPAASYPTVKDDVNVDVLQELRQLSIQHAKTDDHPDVSSEEKPASPPPTPIPPAAPTTSLQTPAQPSPEATLQPPTASSAAVGTPPPSAAVRDPDDIFDDEDNAPAPSATTTKKGETGYVDVDDTWGEDL